MPESLQQFEGKYEILKKLAEGGMGAVYKVRHRLLDEIRVVKVMRPQMEQHKQSRDRFLREARIAVGVRHRNIAQMYDFSIDEQGTAFIVLEYVDGSTLQEILKKGGPPPVALALEIAQQSLQSLAYLHQKGIVHRDISPDNLMLTRDDWGKPLIKLIDLGIAKLEDGDSNLTGTGVFLGKVRYASPEAFKSQEGAQVDSRSDIYSFGLVLYELLTGVHPIGGKTWSELIAGHLFQPPQDFATSDPDNRIPETVRQIIIRAIAKAPGDRFQSSGDFRTAVIAEQGGFPGAAEELEPVLASCRAERTGETVEPGSTQGRLDQHFRPGRTQTQGGSAQAPTGPQSPPSPASATRHEQRVEALLHAAERLVGLELHAEAKVQLEALLEFDPGNARAQELLDLAEAPAHRDRTIAETRTRVEGLIGDGSLEEAQARLDSVIAKLGEVEELRDLRHRVERLRDERRGPAVKALIEEGRSLQAQGNYDEAVSRLERAVELDQNHLLAQAQLAEAREARQKERERREGVASALRSVERLIAQERLDEALAHIGQATQRFGDAAELRELSARVHGLQHRLRQTAVDAVLAEARALSAEGLHERAISKLEEALGIDSESHEALAALGEAREGLRRQREEHQRAANRDRASRTAQHPGEGAQSTRPVAAPERPPEDATRRFGVIAETGPAQPVTVPQRPHPASSPSEGLADRPLTGARATAARRKPEERGGPSRAAWAAAAAAIIVLIVVTVVVVRALAPPATITGAGATTPSGTLVLDAAPWAEVLEITNGQGETMPLPGDRFTPLHLSLPEGEYRVSLRRPEATDPVTLDTVVTAGETEQRLERFDTLDAEAFLEKYGL